MKITLSIIATLAWLRGEMNDRIEADETLTRRWLFGTIGYEHVAWVDPASVFGIGIFGEVTAVRVPSSIQGAYGQQCGATTTIGIHGQWMYVGGDHGM